MSRSLRKTRGRLKNISELVENESIEDDEEYRPEPRNRKKESSSEDDEDFIPEYCSRKQRKIKSRKIKLHSPKKKENIKIEHDDFVLESSHRMIEDRFFISNTSINESLKTTKLNNKKENKNVNSGEDIEERALPTLAGGYSHTKSSKAKIAKANKGNTPWNKGRKRSEEDKAKISAGVRATNRQVLLKKIEKMGITEEEWFRRRKKIKLEREIERRRRVKLTKKLEKEQLEIEVREEKKMEPNNEIKEKEKEKEKIVQLKRNEKMEEQHVVSLKKKKKKKVEDLELKNENEKKTKVNKPSEIFWTPHLFDKDGTSYAKCPSGGPGGLVCCYYCSSSYSQFLTSTAEDIEKNTINLVACEMNDILNTLEETQCKLQEMTSTTSGTKT